MTNGEKIIKIIGKEPLIDTFGNPYILFNKNWWNTEYKESTKNDLEVDSTPNTISFKEMMDDLKITAEDIENAEDLEYSIESLIHPKNDLEVDCISRFEVSEIINEEWLKDNMLDRINALPSVSPQLSVPEIITALSEQRKKLTKECEEAYNKGYEDGVKSINICPYCGEYIGEEE